MISAVHNKFNTLRNSIKLSDNQLVPDEFVMMYNMIFKILCSVNFILKMDGFYSHLL